MHAEERKRIEVLMRNELHRQGLSVVGAGIYIIQSTDLYIIFTGAARGLTSIPKKHIVTPYMMRCKADEWGMFLKKKPRIIRRHLNIRARTFAGATEHEMEFDPETGELV